MKISSFIIFISIVLTIYTAINYYIYIRGLQAIPIDSKFRTFYKISFLIIFLSYIIARSFSNVINEKILEIFNWIGSFWLAGMLYFFLFIVLIDIFRLLNTIFSIYPSIITQNYTQAKMIAAISVFSLVAIIIFSGYINQCMPKIQKLNLHIAKKANGLKSLHIVVATDIHFGNLFEKHRIHKLTEQINSLNPDIVLFGGDIVSEELNYVLKNHSGEPLKNIKAPLGVYAITGNHEFIGGVNRACEYLSSLNIKMLRDSVICINNQFYLIGRDDMDRSRYIGIPRKPLEELMKNVDKSLPLILLDHQPFKLFQASQNSIDLQISGHTHHGQLFPINLITNAIYEKSHGYLKKKIHIFTFLAVTEFGVHRFV